MKITHSKVSKLQSMKVKELNEGDWFTYGSPHSGVDYIRQLARMSGTTKRGNICYPVVTPSKPTYMLHEPNDEEFKCYPITVKFVDGGIEWDYK